MKTPSYPLLSAGNWSWEDVEEALTDFIKRKDDTVENVFVHSPENPERVTDHELNDRLFADVDRSSGYTEKEIRFVLDVTYDQLLGDSLQFTEIELLN